MSFRILIEGQEYKFFTTASVALKYDSVASSFAIDSNFIGTPQQRDFLVPLTYKRIQIYIGEPTRNNLILTGVILRHDFTTKAQPDGLKISGYSLPGVLADCEIPPSIYPLQDDNKTLRQVIEKILNPFGLNLFVNQIATADADKVIPQTEAKEVENAASYIVQLASQFNLIVGHTRNGELLLTRLRTSEAPVSNYEEGTGSFQAATLSTNGQAVHNTYTILRQPGFLDGILGNNPQEQIGNGLITEFRPKVKKQTTGDESTIIDSAKSARMKGLADAVSISLELTTHHYQDGSIIRPNRVITLVCPSIYISNKISIFVKDVTLNETPTGVSAVLDCVLLESFTGEEVQNIFS